MLKMMVSDNNSNNNNDNDNNGHQSIKPRANIVRARIVLINDNNNNNNTDRHQVLVSNEETTTFCCCPNSKTFNKINSQTNNRNIYLISYLIGILLFFIVLNIFLILWIVLSLNLHQNSAFVRIKSTKVDQFIDIGDEHRLRINGDLVSTTNQTLYTDLIEAQYLPPANPDPVESIHSKLRNYLKIWSSQLQIQSDLDGEKQSKNSIKLLPNGNIEIGISKKLSIKSEKPRRSLHVEPDRLIIEDSSMTPQLQLPIGGLRMNQLNTNLIVGSIREDLSFESRTEKLNMFASDNINLESNHGKVELKSFEELSLNADILRIDSRAFLLSNLNEKKSISNKMMKKSQFNHKRRHDHHHHVHHQNQNQQEQLPIAYQVCMCSNGQWFAAEENILCQADKTICGSSNQ